MQQRSCSVAISWWSRWIRGARQAGGLALLVTSTTGFAPPRPPDRVQIGSISASLFTFGKTQEDDPSQEAGGWQEANAVLKFADGRQEPVQAWSCTINVGMPLRTVKRGTINAEWAAKASASVATEASSTTMHSKSQWTPASFCKAFKDEMNKVFADSYKGLGARVLNKS